MTLCPFCTEEFQKLAFARNQYFLAVPNRAPIVEGHIIIVTKRHTCSILELSVEESQSLVTFVQYVCKILSFAYNSQGFDFSLQDGAAAGQTVYHFHLHIIPRFFNDLPSPGAWYGRLYGYDDSLEIDSNRRPVLAYEQQVEICEKLKSILSSIS